jgi:hypothetical protein
VARTGLGVAVHERRVLEHRAALDEAPEAAVQPRRETFELLGDHLVDRDHHDQAHGRIALACGAARIRLERGGRDQEFEHRESILARRDAQISGRCLSSAP